MPASLLYGFLEYFAGQARQGVPDFVYARAMNSAGQQLRELRLMSASRKFGACPAQHLNETDRH